MVFGLTSLFPSSMSPPGPPGFSEILEAYPKKKERWDVVLQELRETGHVLAAWSLERGQFDLALRYGASDGGLFNIQKAIGLAAVAYDYGNEKKRAFEIVGLVRDPKVLCWTALEFLVKLLQKKEFYEAIEVASRFFKEPSEKENRETIFGVLCEELLNEERPDLVVEAAKQCGGVSFLSRIACECAGFGSLEHAKRILDSPEFTAPSLPHYEAVYRTYIGGSGNYEEVICDLERFQDERIRERLRSVASEALIEKVSREQPNSQFVAYLELQLGKSLEERVAPWTVYSAERIIRKYELSTATRIAHRILRRLSSTEGAPTDPIGKEALYYINKDGDETASRIARRILSGKRMGESEWERVHLAERVRSALSLPQLRGVIRWIKKGKNPSDPEIREFTQAILAVGVLPEAVEVASGISEKAYRDRAISSLALKYFELEVAESRSLGGEEKKSRLSKALIKAQEILPRILSKRVRKAALDRLLTLVRTLYRTF